MLAIKDGEFVKTRNFELDDIYSVDHVAFNEFDEVILVCKDHEFSGGFIRAFNFISELVRVPLAASGRINTLDDAKRIFDLGAEKIVLNSILWTSLDVVKSISNLYGKQSIVASFDLLGGKTGLQCFDWITMSGHSLPLPNDLHYLHGCVGEILLQDVSRDGRSVGPNTTVFKEFIKQVNPDVPIHIGSCGNTSWEHYISLLNIDYVDAVAATNVHHLSAQAVSSLKSYCKLKGVQLR